MRQLTLIKICEIPIAFSRGNKSPFELAFSSGFVFARKRDSIKQIKQYLLGRDSLLNLWQQWSDDKRTSNGYYLKLEANLVGYFDLSKGGIVKEVDYETSIDACAEFILLEVASILNISLNSAKIYDLKWDLGEKYKLYPTAGHTQLPGRGVANVGSLGNHAGNPTSESFEIVN